MSISNSQTELPSAPDDEGLIAAARISELYASHFGPLCSFLRKHMGASDEVADIAQQAFCEAFKGYRGYSGRASLQTWLYGIALNLMRSHLAQTRRAVYITLDDFQMDIEDPSQVPADDALNAREELHHVFDLLNQCSECSRRALWMVAVDGLSYGEAAEALQMTDSTVRSRVSRLRSELRMHLGMQHALKQPKSVPRARRQALAQSAALAEQGPLLS